MGGGLIKDMLIDAQIEPTTTSKAAARTGAIAFHKTKGKAELSDGTEVRRLFDNASKLELNTCHVNGADYTVLDNDNYVYLKVTTGAVDRTITLPTLADNLERVLLIEKIDTGIGSVIIDGEGAETIDAYTTITTRGKIAIIGETSEWKTLYGNPYLIQSRTIVASPGTALQQFAGADLSLAELDHFFGAGNTKAYHRFGAGAALGTDEVGSYNLYASGPTNTTGFMNTNYGASFNAPSHELFQQANLLDDMTTTYSGAGKGLWHHFVMEMPADGQTSAMGVFDKWNSLTKDRYTITISNGVLIVYTKGNFATPKTVSSSILLPNGANTIFWFVDVLWNTTTGLSLYINRQMQDCDPTATTLMSDYEAGGTTFFIGYNSTGLLYYTGKIMHSAIINLIPTEAQMDIFYATKVAEPAQLTGQQYNIIGLREPGGDTNMIQQANVEEVARYNGSIYLQGGTRAPEDYYTLYGRR